MRVGIGGEAVTSPHLSPESSKGQDSLSFSLLTSANVDQRCRGFHEGQLLATDKARGLGGEVHRQHHKVGLLQQVFHISTESRLNDLLIFPTSKESEDQI